MGLPGLDTPYVGTFFLANRQRPIRGATILNQSTVGFGLYLNKPPQGAPDVIVPAGLALGLPLPSVYELGYAFQISISNPPIGQIYIHITTDLVVSTASQVGGAGSGAVWDSSKWDASTWQ